MRFKNKQKKTTSSASAIGTILLSTFVLLTIFQNKSRADSVVILPFDEGTGSVSFDYSGHGNNGLLSNGVNYDAETNDGSSYSLYFDGVEGFVDLGGLDVPGNSLTLASWLKPVAYNNEQRDGRLISKASGISANEHVFMLSTIRVGNETRLRARLNTGSRTKTLIASTGDLSIQRWYHAAFTYDGEYMRLYLNGVEVGRSEQTGEILQDDRIHVSVGSQQQGAGSRYFTGLLDDVRILDHALSKSEIEAIASKSVLANDRPPIAIADEYSVPVNYDLVRTSVSGVLANDIVNGTGVLRTVLVDDVAHGGLTLNPNGSFRYAANADFSGSDEFTYQVTDGVYFSSVAVVKINVYKTVSTGLIAMLTMNEGDGEVTLDFSGKGNNGYLLNGAVFDKSTADGSLYSIRLDGIDDLVDIGSLDASENGFTLMGWFKAHSFPVSGTSSEIISKAAGIVNQIFSLSVVNVGSLRRVKAIVRIRGVTKSVIANSDNLDLGMWYHTAIRIDANYLTLFLNGVKVGQVSVSGTIDIDPLMPVIVGGRSVDQPVNLLNGMVDDIRIYEQALSEEEIRNISISAGEQIAAVTDINQLVVADESPLSVNSDQPVIQEVEDSTAESPALAIATDLGGHLSNKEQLLANLDSAGNEDKRMGVYAFPGATGHGKKSTGGRGGRVFCVNTLDDINVDGDGLISYREAVSGINEANVSSRIVTFCVSGEIYTGVYDAVRVERGQLTVACQTAPSPGIVITGYRPVSLNSNVDDVVWRYCDIKLRDTLDSSRNMTNRGVAIGGRAQGAPSRLMFDHMSIMWSTDDSFSIHVNSSTERTVPDHITLMQSIVGEGDTTCKRRDSECGNASNENKQTGDYRFPNHSTGPQNSSLNGTQIGGISHVANVFANTVSRNPQIRGAYGEVINNFVFNMYGDGTRASASAGAGTTNDLYIENNIYKEGPDTRVHTEHLIYKDGNYVVNGNVLIRKNGSVIENYKSNSTKRLNHPREYLDGDSKLNLSCVGASRPYRDSADRRIIAEANGVGTLPVLPSAEIGIGPRVPPVIGPCTPGEYCFYEGSVDDQGQRDYTDYLPTRTHGDNYDTDADGIADTWENLLIDSDQSDSLNSLTDIDHTTDADNDGYLDVEEWLNSLAQCHSN